jgi:hypothetical protein
MAEAALTLPKGEFAKHLGVSPGRVSQMISEGKISPDAIDGEGRSARIKVAVAIAQIRERTDVGQRFGNGLATNLENFEKSPTLIAGGATFQVGGDTIDAQIKREKLREVEFKNRDAARKELEGRGDYVRTYDVQAAVAGMAASMVTVFEGALSDFAKAISAKHELPNRDVLHLLRAEFVAVRARMSDAYERAAERLPIVIEDDRSEGV